MTKSEIDAILSRMEIRMAELGMSKEHFYELSGISSASFSQWNTGAHKPTKKKIGQAAAVLGVSFEYLWLGEGQKNKPALPQENELDDELVELLTELRPDEVQLLVAYAQGIIAARKNS